MLSKGNNRYILCAITVFAGTLASLGGCGWFDGS
jgi:hypothetical protein